MKLPKIFLKSFLLILLLSSIYFGFIFSIFIPQIEKNIISLEDSIGKAQLEKTVQIIQNSALELKNYEAIALEQRKDELKKLTDVVYNIIQVNYKESLKEGANVTKIKEQTLQLIAKLQYGNSDYFYVSTYDDILISHPYLKNKDFSKIKDVYGNLVVPPLVKIAREKGEGFIRYWWKKNNEDPTPYEKLTYAKNFSPWGWVVGTGVYIDDINREVQNRKKKLIERLKKILRSTKIGKSGYVYIFDSSGNMLIHPNITLENINFKDWKNPGKESYIFDDLVDAYKHGNKTLYYNWDTPSDKKNYSYKKISWIEYEPTFDWYICSSAYLDEFYQDSDNLKSFIISFAVIMTLFLILIGLYFLKQIFYPIVALAKNAEEVKRGNLQSRYTGEINNDETGLLAQEFNNMLDTINSQIDTLDKKVQEKTEKLTIALNEKEILFKELNHRVKNNLYVINSIIGLQAFQEEKVSLEQFIEIIQHRIDSMALGHEMLNRSKDSYTVDTKEYITTLVDSLIKAYIENPSSCKCIYKIDSFTLNMDKLLSCGLIINELVTNAIKYAFNSKENQLTISFIKVDDMLELSVKDNGAGFKRGEYDGVGLELVEMLVTQLEGTIEFKNERGSSIIIKFKS